MVFFDDDDDVENQTNMKIQGINISFLLLLLLIIIICDTLASQTSKHGKKKEGKKIYNIIGYFS